MGTAGFIIGIIFVLLGFMCMLLGIENGWFFLGSCIFFLFAIGCFETMNKEQIAPEPTIQDVYEKRARIVETQTIAEGDTVRTYKMIWNKNN